MTQYYNDTIVEWMAFLEDRGDEFRRDAYDQLTEMQGRRFEHVADEAIEYVMLVNSGGRFPRGRVS